MRPLSAQQLLAAWERGLKQRPLERALILLEAACPESPPETLASMSIGRRDAALLTLREWVFGPRMACCAACPRCGQHLEMSLQVADIRLQSSDAELPELSLSVAGYEVRFRPPNSMDLAACAGSHIAEIRKQVFALCLIDVRSRNKPVAVDRVPEEVAQPVIEHMAKADPQADLQVDIACPACDHHWRECFDIVSFFWGEIDAWAHSILREVHALASAYGWRESDILALSPLRRQSYIEMADA